MTVPPFPAGYRASGVLLHVTSLPSPHGIGDVGPTAMAWVDRLHEAKQAWWQALPLGPTGYGDSPYQSLSSFAGNSLLISPAALAMAPLQDVLNLGKEARMNQPGSAEGNWRWRVADEMLSASALDSLRDVTLASTRDETAMVVAS